MSKTIDVHIYYQPLVAEVMKVFKEFGWVLDDFSVTSTQYPFSATQIYLRVFVPESGRHFDAGVRFDSSYFQSDDTQDWASKIVRQTAGSIAREVLDAEL